MDIRNKKVVILGAARSGMSAAQLLLKKGAIIFVSDIANRKIKHDEIKRLEDWDIEYEFGEHSEKIFEADLAILSPGIPKSAQVVKKMLERKIPVYSELELASWFCSSPIIAVTGSNGKTTTTTLLGEMLKTEIPRTVVAGNIGIPFSEQALNCAHDAWAVLEVSSFQLETIDTFHPKITAILNLAPNHLDWYSTYDKYIDAKLRILKNIEPDDYLIYNSDDPLLNERLQDTDTIKLTFSTQNKNAEAYWQHNTIYLYDEKFMSCKNIQLQGLHNYMNIMAATLAATCAGVSKKSLIKILNHFKGVEHRLEFVATIGGIHFINDSKATTLEALDVALNSFDSPIILIAGGKDKGSDFHRLNDLIQKKVRLVILIGAASEKIAKAWKNTVPVTIYRTLKEAVKGAFDEAEKGNHVLLSPACASFDMFLNFEDRGSQFKSIVQQLKNNYENN
jgi:UDP-N-acetylmuramoylalanine--D-glutamate ligase